jgi:hypothetical protein
MKYLLTIIILLSCFHIGYAQGGSCTISINGKTIATNKPTESNLAAKTSILGKSLKKTNKFKFVVKEKNPQTDWHRVFIFFDKDGQELGRYIQKSTSGIFLVQTDFAVPKTGNSIKIETMLEPNDVNAAATMRLRTFPLIDISIK